MTTMFDFDDDPEDFLAAVEGRRYRHKNRGKRRPTIQTVTLQEQDTDYDD